MTDEADAEELARVERAVARQRRVFGHCGATPALTEEQARLHGPAIAEAARLVVERWRDCESYASQPLSVAVIDLKRAIVQASTWEGSGHGLSEPAPDGAAPG